MTTPDKCPLCGNPEVIAGHIQTDKGPFGFRPVETRKSFHFTARRVFAFDFGPEASFCAHCNLVWSRADPKDAADFIRKFGTEELQGRFAAVRQTQPPP